MKIIGGHDFYDSAAQFGVDEDVVFVRGAGQPIAENDFHGSLWPFFPRSRLRYALNHRSDPVPVGPELWRIYPFVIIVAGTRHAGLRIEPVEVASGSPAPVSFLWSFDDFQAWRISRGAVPLTTNELAAPWIASQQHFFDSQLTQDQANWLIENRVVIATAIDIQEVSSEPRLWRVNGDDLKAYQFFHRVGAPELFQQIAGYIGGVLGGPAPDLVQIVDDEIKRDKKGFDEKSFRKDKQIGSKRRRGRKA